MGGAKSIRREGWPVVFIFLVVTIVVGFVWFKKGLYVSWIAIIFGFGLGTALYLVDTMSLRPLIELPLVLVYSVITTTLIIEKTLISGAVAACVAVTAAKAYDVYM
ncbi:hypothetical protein [Natrinema sp. SYSU A 869]|uniref:hypothetical protein n=1 Tax=Natrinema sp. SYSU A 869 TaxID=2871694 RepID=UPI001CA410C3|nr:hypothetical protein [Natrinema sp. SYSU A 869]